MFAKKWDFESWVGVTFFLVNHSENYASKCYCAPPDCSLLSYHVALLKGTSVEQPRNLAPSVTVVGIPDGIRNGKMIGLLFCTAGWLPEE